MKTVYILYYKDYSAFITATRELEDVRSCELYEAFEDIDTIRWECNLYNIPNISRHAHAYMLIIGEIEDDDDMEVYNQIVLNKNQKLSAIL